MAAPASSVRTAFMVAFDGCVDCVSKVACFSAIMVGIATKQVLVSSVNEFEGGVGQPSCGGILVLRGLLLLWEVGFELLK
jgi:hypothetical protein